MPIQVAVKTLKAIEAALKADQGAAYRQNLGKVIPHIGDAYRGEEDPFRKHLGASVIGEECARKVWYSFRWTTLPKFDGRILRLFNRGHLEEARFIAALLTIGVDVYQQDAEGKQYRISDVGGHFGGSGDGVGINIPDLPAGTPALLEFKTHNDKSFKKLSSVGVREAKFEHFVQMQCYMRKMQLFYALYGAVNKNDDDLHFEIVQLDTLFADQFLDRARQIILSLEPPKKINESPGWFACSWCDHKAVCHLKARPERNCRTCVHAIPRDDGVWYCTQPENDAQYGDNIPLTVSMQREGCEKYQPLL
jgi:hypothetical protein